MFQWSALILLARRAEDVWTSPQHATASMATLETYANMVRERPFDSYGGGELEDYPWSKLFFSWFRQNKHFFLVPGRSKLFFSGLYESKLFFTQPINFPANASDIAHVSQPNF